LFECEDDECATPEKTPDPTPKSLSKSPSITPTNKITGIESDALWGMPAIKKKEEVKEVVIPPSTLQLLKTLKNTFLFSKDKSKEAFGQIVKEKIEKELIEKLEER